MKLLRYGLIALSICTLSASRLLEAHEIPTQKCNNKVCTEIHNGSAVCLQAQSPPSTTCNDLEECSWDWCESEV